MGQGEMGQGEMGQGEMGQGKIRQGELGQGEIEIYQSKANMRISTLAMFILLYLSPFAT